MSSDFIQPQSTEIIMYQTEDGLTKIDVQMSDETVWLTREQMAELFQKDRSVIGKHIKNIFDEGEFMFDHYETVLVYLNIEMSKWLRDLSFP